MQQDEEAPVLALLSVNQFTALAEQHNLGMLPKRDISKELPKLLEVFANETLSKKLDAAIVFKEFLQNKPNNQAVEALLNQTRSLIRLILGADNEREIPGFIQYRNKRRPFKPNIVRPLPEKSPVYPLLEDCVVWDQEVNQELADDRLNTIKRAASTTFSHVPIPSAVTRREQKIPAKPRRIAALHIEKKPATKKSILPYKRRLFIAFSVAHSLHGVTISRASTVADEEHQIIDTTLKVKEYPAKELENYRALSYQGRLYKIQLDGKGDNRRIAVSYFSTKGLSAHGKYHDQAIFVVTTDGDIFATSTFESEKPGKTVYHSSLDRNPLFSGRFRVSAQGRLLYYNNHTGHFKNNELNLRNLEQFLYSNGLISDQNPEVVGALILQRIFAKDQQFVNYVRRFPESLLWTANHKLLGILELNRHLPEARKVSYETAFARAIEEAIEEHSTHHDRKQWNESWNILLASNNHTREYIRDNLLSDPINTHQFIAAKKGVACDLPAQDDRLAGIRNDLDPSRKEAAQKVRLVSQAPLDRLRKNSLLKLRLDHDNLRYEFTYQRPPDDEIAEEVIYYFPHARTVCQYCLRLPNGDIYTGRIEYESINNIGLRNKLRITLQSADQHDDLSEDDKRLLSRDFFDYEKRLLIHAATTLHPYEIFLLADGNKLQANANPKLDPITIIQANVSADITAAYLNEMQRHAIPRHTSPFLQPMAFWNGIACRNRAKTTNLIAEYKPVIKRTFTDFFDPPAEPQKRQNVAPRNQPQRQLLVALREEPPHSAPSMSLSSGKGKEEM
jgi:hypothetical protein